MFKALTEIAFDWGCRCFGFEHMNNRSIRGLRFAEEAIELAQACGVSEDKMAELVRVVYSRPVGEAYQEVGGSMVTLTVLCRTLGIDLENAFQVEVRRLPFERFGAFHETQSGQDRSWPDRLAYISSFGRRDEWTTI